MGQTNRTSEFRSKFPPGKIPALECPDGTCIFESDAIAQYVAESRPRAAQLVGATPAQRAQIRQWICFAGSEAMDPVVQLVLWRVGMRPYDEAVETTALAGLERSLDCLERHLVGRRWLATEDELSLADLSLASSLYWGFMQVIDKEMRDKYPRVVAWSRDVIESDGVREVFKDQVFVVKRRTFQG